MDVVDTPCEFIDAADLGGAISRDGFAPHEGEIADLVEQIRAIAPDLASLDVIADESAPPVVRSRAFTTAVGHAKRVERALAEQAAFDQSFGTLAELWEAHQQLRASGSDTAELWHSRNRLDAQRLEIARRGREAVGAAPVGV